MTFSNFISDLTNKELVIDINDLEIRHDCKRIYVNDNRSYQDDKGFFHVKPIAFVRGKNFPYIVCPFCGEIHRHGQCFENMPKNSHCRLDDVKGIYIID